MDKNTIIGFALIFILLLAWAQFNKPSPEEIERQKQLRDSIALAEQQQLAEAEMPAADTSEAIVQEVPATVPDSVRRLQLAGRFGPFSGAAAGKEQSYVLENDQLRITFTNKGGRIREVYLKEHVTKLKDAEGNKVEIPVRLLEDEKNRFEYLLPVPGTPEGIVSTEDLFFQAEPSGNAITFRATATGGATFEQKYSLGDDYELSYTLDWEGLEPFLSRNAESFTLNWVNYLSPLEKNVDYERNYSTVYFKPETNGVDYCSCRSSDEEEVEKRVKWVSNANQFFNSSLIAERSFASADLETIMLEDGSGDLKKLQSRVEIPMETASFSMKMYVGPNEFKRLAAYDMSLEDIIPYGWSVFGTINRWVIRPLFNFLAGLIGAKGLAILLLTLLVKLAVYPLTYKMLHSQSKMAALKPEMAKLNEKFSDDQQKKQMETMKLYREFGVNPFGGCFPMILQLPIWFALYRFFPAAFQFRNAEFLWATDLSSFDELVRLGVEIPMYGSHISLFTLLWAVITLGYTWYNSRIMDMTSSMNPMMKYVQYLMPVTFLVFFNSLSSGLTCYLAFSSFLNIAQTVVTKNYVINQDKIKREMEAYRKKPKKKRSSFQERLEQAMKEQQKLQQQKAAGKAKRKK